MAARFGSAVSLSEVDPKLIEHLDPEQAAAARSRAFARVAIPDNGGRDPLGLRILGRLRTRSMTLLGRTTMTLPDAGDLVRPKR
jgi:hypothetical protein